MKIPFALHMRALTVLLVGLGACTSTPAPTSSLTGIDAGTVGCAILFGNPVAATGLDMTQCRPECACGGTVYAPPVYGPAFIQALIDDWRLATPYPEVPSDPYLQPAPTPDPVDTVCAVHPLGPADGGVREYTLVTYPSLAAATSAGDLPTHYGHCGVCSPLADLAVYLRENDLTAPARACAEASGPIVDGGGGDVMCLMALGFDLPCAQAWAYDADHTRSVCLSTCLLHLTDPYNEPDGALNPCIQCDEDQSGPVFQSVAGRTRRNSGVPNAICRPCSEVRPLVHQY